MGLIQDLRYALRVLAKSPTFAATAILTLALGVGVNVGTFSLLRAVTNLPDRFVDPEQLVFLEAVNERNQRQPIRPADYLVWKERAASFAGLGLYTRRDMTVSGRGEVEQLRAVQATADLLPMLGLRPQLGRLHTGDEDSGSGEPVMLLSDGLWRRKFDADPGVLGRSMQLDGVAHTVIGVLPPEFDLEQMWFQVEVLTPLHLDPTDTGESGVWYTAVGRLRPGVDGEQAGAEMKVIAAGLPGTGPDARTPTGVRLRSLPETFFSSADRLAFHAMLGAVGLVLVIACANLANLQLAKASSRGRELAVRTALGASRGRILRQLLVESLVLAVLGGALGLLIGTWAVDLVVASLDYVILERHEVGVSAAVVLYTLVLSVLAAVVSGLAPALAASRVQVADSLREGQGFVTAGRRGNRLRGALVVAQLSVALPLLICCGLTVKHVRGIKAIDYGFDTERLLMLRMDMPQHRYGSQEEMSAFLREALDAIRATPGIEAAEATLAVPVILLLHANVPVTIEGREPADPQSPDAITFDTVSAGFFDTLGIPVRRGRLFGDRDRAGALPVGVVNARLARRYWPDEDPVGKRLRLTGDGASGAWITVVGEVADAGRTVFGEPPPATLYLPYEQRPQRGVQIAVRTSGAPLDAVPAVRGAIHALDDEVPVRDFHSAQGYIDEVCRDDRMAVAFLAGLAALALGLGAIGLYGVLSFVVQQRTREIGVRVALGAGYRSILGLVLSRCLRLALLGVVIGIVAAIPAGLGIESQLWGVSGMDPVAYATVSLLLLGVALLAGYLPARRAAKVDPIVALRCE